MKIIDCEPDDWFLYEHKGKLLLEANCNHSFFGYIYTIELNPIELETYKKGGHEYISNLSHEIHDSAPAAIDSKSEFKGRNVQDTYSKLTDVAYKAWKENNE